MTTPLNFLPTELDVIIPTGATFHYQFRWLIGGVPQPLTGYTAVMSFARRAGRDPLLAVSTSTGEIALEPPDVNGNPRVGLIDVLIAAPKTALLTRTGRYDVVVIDSVGNVFRLFEGVAVASRGVTLIAGDPTPTPAVATGPARRNLILYRGDSFAMSFKVASGGAPVNLTGYVPTAQVRGLAGTLLATFTATVPDQTAYPGRVDLLLTGDQTTTLSTGATYDVQLMSPDGSVRTYLAGTVTVSDDVTH